MSPEASAPEFADARWRQLDVPHDFSVEGEFARTNASGTAFLPGGIAWYRKSFTVPADWKNKIVEIEFDGVSMNSEVWINGHSLGKRPYAYSSFAYDLTPYLRIRRHERHRRPCGPQRNCRLALLRRLGNLSARVASCHRTDPHSPARRLCDDAAKSPPTTRPWKFKPACKTKPLTLAKLKSSRGLIAPNGKVVREVSSKARIAAIDQ